MYTTNDLKSALAELTRELERKYNYSGNNPNKHESAIKAARRKVDIIESFLKSNGTIPLTEQERLNNELDRAYPNTPHNKEVEYQGQKYKSLYTCAERTRSRRPKRREHTWIAVKQQ